MNKPIVRIGNRVVNLNNVTYVIDRTVHFNDGTKWTALEPELQELFAALFESARLSPVEVAEEPRPMPVNVDIESVTVKKPTTRKKK